MSRNSKRSDQEWLALIHECRNSGLSDKHWCEEHHIHTSNFYYQIRRLRNKACEIPESSYAIMNSKQEIVEVSFTAPASYPTSATNNSLPADTDTAARISLHGIQIEITNAAAGDMVFHILSALQQLC